MPSAICFHEFIYVFTFKYLAAFAGTMLKFVFVHFQGSLNDGKVT